MLDRDLAQRTVGSEGDKIGMRGEQEGIIGAFVLSPFISLLNGLEIRWQTQIIVLDLSWLSEKRGSKAPSQRCFPNTFWAAEKNGLGNAILLDHVSERAGDARVAVEIWE